MLNSLIKDSINNGTLEVTNSISILRDDNENFKLHFVCTLYIHYTFSKTQYKVVWIEVEAMFGQKILL